MSGEIRPEIEIEEEQRRQGGEGKGHRGEVRQETIGFSEIEEEITVAGGRGRSDDGAWYVAVGRDEESSLDALQWTLRNRCLNKGGASSPPSPSPSSSTSSSSSTSHTGCVYLVHVFPPVTHIPTPVGKLAKSQVTHEQLKLYKKEENNRRRSLLQKYIKLCDDAKVKVDTILIESSTTAKAILELIPVLQIRRLVIGAKRSSRWSKKPSSKAEFLQKNAPEFCEIIVISDGKQLPENQNVSGTEPSSPTTGSSRKNTATLHSPRSSKIKSGVSPRQQERNFFECTCFSGKFS
ncbi:U-box domain-containing protein 33 [Nymphaea thermarum]|nr:U-box domain-containing protein 33 [Nymphaea thermarum]